MSNTGILDHLEETDLISPNLNESDRFHEMDQFSLVGIHVFLLHYSSLETNIRGHFWEGEKHGGRKTEPLQHFCL